MKIFNVIYTKHKFQKNKKWLDGKFKFNEKNRKVILKNNKIYNKIY